MNRNDRDIFRNAANGIDPFGGTSSFVARPARHEDEWIGLEQERYPREAYPRGGDEANGSRARGAGAYGGYGYGAADPWDERYDWDPRSFYGRDDDRDRWNRRAGGERGLGQRIAGFFHRELGHTDEHHPGLWQRMKGAFAGKGPKGWKRSDERIREDVCEALAYHPYIDASDVEVAVADGEVTLTGAVEDRRTKRLVEDVVDDVHGVTDVHNQLRLGGVRR